jgi:ferric-dicitrate binding protein FerR (iron transport regulator)
MASKAPRKPPDVRKEAANWVYLLHTTEDDDLTELLPSFRTWLTTSPEHRREYSRLETIWREMDKLLDREGLLRDSTVPNLETTDPVRASQRRRRWTRPVVVTVIVLILSWVCLTSYYTYRYFALTSCHGAPAGCLICCLLVKKQGCP